PAVSSRADEVTPQQQVSGQGLSDNVDDENTYKAPSLQGDVLSLSKQGTTKQSRKKNRTDEKSGTSFDKQLKARISKISTLISQDKLSEVIANAGLSTTTSVASDVPFSKETREPADFLRQLLDEAATFLESTQPHDIAESTILQITTAFGVETAAGILLQILAAKQGMVLAQILPGFLKHISSISADGHSSAVALKSFLEKEKLFGLKQVDAAFDLPDSRESVSETASIITEQGQQPISLSDDKEFTVAENSAFGAISQWLYGDAFGQEKEDILFQHTKIAEFTGFLLQGDQLGLQQSEMEAIQQEIRTAYHDFLTETKSSQTGLPPDVADIDITKPEHLRISRIWTAMLLGLIQHIVPEPETTVQRQQPLPAHFFHGMTFPDALIALIAATSLTQSYSPLLLVNKMNDMANAEFLLPVAHFLQQQFGAKKGIKPLLSNHLLRSYLENGLVAAGETRISAMEETEITPLSMKDYADELVDFVHAGDQEEAYRKLIDEKHDWTKQKTQDKKIYIENAGLAIIWLYLPSLFKKLNLVDAKGFVSEDARERAVLLLQYIVTGEEEAPEYLLMLNKILCGMMILQPVRQNVQLTDEEKEEAIVLIKSVVKNWPILGNTSVEGFRNTFLKREGTLFLKEGNWNLKVESKTLDILMRKMPWGIGTIKLSWNKYIIFVEWNY
ncbi:MAG: hypothetical protein KKA07_02345, partial [Bacteroidetes bacterium]|nr:hypothetical protein [Bacteroidota bacterium]